MIEFLIFSAKLLIACFGIYLAARLVFAAFFKSKQHYEREKHHESRP